jgi:hypothetical protein
MWWVTEMSGYRVEVNCRYDVCVGERVLNQSSISTRPVEHVFLFFSVAVKLGILH